MSQAINLIITCDHVDCPYNYEKECGKEILYVDDAECIAQGRSEDNDEKSIYKSTYERAV